MFIGHGNFGQLSRAKKRFGLAVLNYIITCNHFTFW
jgi:hypothetical protein